MLREQFNYSKVKNSVGHSDKESVETSEESDSTFCRNLKMNLAGSVSKESDEESIKAEKRRKSQETKFG